MYLERSNLYSDNSQQQEEIYSIWNHEIFELTYQPPAYSIFGRKKIILTCAETEKFVDAGSGMKHIVFRMSKDIISKREEIHFLTSEMFVAYLVFAEFVV